MWNSGGRRGQGERERAGEGEGEGTQMGHPARRRDTESRLGGAGHTRLTLPTLRPPSAGWKLGRLLEDLGTS